MPIGGRDDAFPGARISLARAVPHAGGHLTRAFADGVQFFACALFEGAGLVAHGFARVRRFVGELVLHFAELRFTALAALIGPFGLGAREGRRIFKRTIVVHVGIVIEGLAFAAVAVIIAVG